MTLQLNDLRRQQSVIFIVATNRLRSFDAAVTRPGRFDFLLFVGTPNLLSRENRLEARLSSTRLNQLERYVRTYIYCFCIVYYSFLLFPLHPSLCTPTFWIWSLMWTLQTTSISISSPQFFTPPPVSSLAPIRYVILFHLFPTPHHTDFDVHSISSSPLQIHTLSFCIHLYYSAIFPITFISSASHQYFSNLHYSLVYFIF